MNKSRWAYYFLFIAAFFPSCKKDSEQRLFTRLSKSQTGIEFRNLIVEKETFNIFKYQYFYNGGGVALGDFNNDGLQDIVFTGNMVKNRMYLNKGDLEFEDITQQSGIAEKEGWCTGATPVDINQDGWLDLYICRAGYPFDHLRSNLLYINNKDLTFTEKAAEYGLDDLAHSTQASFFDYDKDGDLDLFLLNHSTVEYSRGSLEVLPLREKKDPAFTNKLYRNNGPKAGGAVDYRDVTRESGLYANVLTFSLGVNITDINYDGWPDIFIGNDFNEPDYLFINNRDGTFADQINQRLDHTSMFSMGSDVADFNNDGWLDLVSLDMLPESNHLQKMHVGGDNFDKVALLANAGLLRQVSRNMLQMNNGDGTFSEVGQLAGISNTDWSWTPLFFDFDNDGWKDLFVANGYLRDHTDMDFLKFTADEVIRIKSGKENIGFQDYLKKMPPISQPNYFFQNTGQGCRFVNRTADWGDPEPVVTQGAAYGDLDNDGDLDLAVNNSEEYAFVYRNNAEALFNNNYLRINLKGKPGNPIGIGAKVYVYAGGKIFYLEQNPVRGFQTSVDPVLNVGLGALTAVDSVVVIWPTDEKQVLTNAAINKTLDILQEQAAGKYSYPPVKNTVFTPANVQLPFVHRENNFNDFKSQLLLPYFYSRQGPALAVGDVNGDGREDVFCGGAAGQPGAVFIQTPDGSFKKTEIPEMETDAVDACFAGNSNGHTDLWVAGGSYDADPQSSGTRFRLYGNIGEGRVRAAEYLESNLDAPTCIRAGDANGDGQADLFFGKVVKPGRFPEKLGVDIALIRERTGQLEPVEIPITGLVSDAIWVDINGNGRDELMVAVEWGPIQVFEYQDGKFIARPEWLPTDSLSGLWQSLIAADVDGDGDSDLIAGNLGMNSQFQASPGLPMELYAGDFDQNGSVDPLIFYPVQGRSYPFAAMEDLQMQIPPMKKKFIYFKDYADAGLHEILTDQQMAAASKHKVTTLASVVLLNEGGRFRIRPLPEAAQVAPICAMAAADVNRDGKQDLITGGNMSYSKVKLGSLDGNHGLVLLGDGQGNFQPMPYARSGLNLRGDVRSLKVIEIKGERHLLVGENNQAVKLFKF